MVDTIPGYAIGDVCKYGPSEEAYACFATFSRSSAWIAANADVRHRYHDTGEWSDLRLPTCHADDGALYTSNGMRLERAMAMAWHADSVGYRAVACSKAREIAPSNVRWEGRSAASTTDIKHGVPRRVSPCIRRAVESSVTSTTMQEVATACGTSVTTAWNYLAKGLSLLKSSPVPRCGDALQVPPPCPCHLMDEEIVRAWKDLSDTRGSLSDVLNRLPDAVASLPNVLNQIRILRLYPSEERDRDQAV